MKHWVKIIFVAVSAISILLPVHSAHAIVWPYFRVKSSVIRTNIDQSGFVAAGCVRRNPYITGPNTPMIIDWPIGLKPYWGAGQPTTILGGGAKSVWFCDPVKLQETVYEKGQIRPEFMGSGDGELNSFESMAIFLLNRVLWLLAFIGSWVLYLSSLFLRPLLGVGSFVTNPFVTSGWPFVQGIANLGFLLALLFIAFATTLRIESFSARRMLPRLLFAALFINFSLVIAGLFIDASRLVMASLLTLIIGNGSLDTLAFRLLQSSRMINLVFDTSTFNEGAVGFTGSDTSWRSVVNTLQGTILIWVFSIAFGVLTIGLIVRYIRLILLLIASPLAYLALAMPNMEGMARKWWADFIKYVLYGPVMVFILALLVVATDKLSENSNLLTRQPSTLNDVMQLLIVAAVLLAAGTASKKLGEGGANSALDFVTKRGKQMGKFAVKNPKTAAFMAGGLATGGLGAVGAALAVKGGQMAGEGLKNQYGDAKRYAADRYKKWLPKSIRPIERDDKGNPKPGQQSWTTKKLESKFGAPIKRENVAAVNAAKEAAHYGRVGDPALSKQNLMNSDVANSLDDKDIDRIVSHPGVQPEQLKVLVQNKNVVRVMSGPTKADLLSGSKGPDIAAIIERTMRALANE